MIRALQRRFVAAAMTAITVLLAVLLGAINAAGYVITDRQIETVMTVLLENGGAYAPPGPGGEGFPAPGGPFPGGPTPDAMMGARYFLVAFDAGGAVTHADVEHIYAVTEDQARELAAEIYASGAGEGQYQQFRYRRGDAPDGQGGVLLFLDVSTQQGLIRTVLLASCGGGVLCWSAMLLLVLLLSRRAIRPIARNMERQRQFVTNAGHEIKTPLTIILANTDAMELINGETKWSRNIRAQTVRLTGLMQNLLALARMDEAGAGLPMSEFSLEPLLEEVLEPFRETAESRGITVHTDIRPGLTLRANRESVLQLVSILLDNATKYTPAGGEIWVSCQRPENRLLLRVRNTCDPVPEEELERLFDRFYRGDAARTQSGGGYGIGLSAVRAIAEAHGGSITARSETDPPSLTFSVTL